jgi:hypothetical protein
LNSAFSPFNLSAEKTGAGDQSAVQVPVRKKRSENVSDEGGRATHYGQVPKPNRSLTVAALFKGIA